MNHITTQIALYKYGDNCSSMHENNIMTYIRDNSINNNINNILVDDKNLLMLLYNQNIANVMGLAIKLLDLGLKLNYTDKNNENILFYILRNIRNINVNIDSLILFLKDEDCDPYIRNSNNVRPIDLIKLERKNLLPAVYKQIMKIIATTHKHNKNETIFFINNIDDNFDFNYINKRWIDENRSSSLINDAFDWNANSYSYEDIAEISSTDGINFNDNYNMIEHDVDHDIERYIEHDNLGESMFTNDDIDGYNKDIRGNYDMYSEINKYRNFDMYENINEYCDNNEHNEYNEYNELGDTYGFNDHVFDI